jgi:hypothetical protein
MQSEDYSDCVLIQQEQDIPGVQMSNENYTTPSPSPNDQERTPTHVIIKNLMGPVWTKPTKDAKPSKTWRKLRPGDQLTNNKPMLLDGHQILLGARWVVDSVNSAGAALRLLAPPESVRYQLATPEWSALFTKQRKLTAKQLGDLDK